jgi:hypothetical protein
MFTYLNVELAPFADYFGGMNHGVNYLGLIAALIGFLAFACFMLRRLEIRRV